MSKSTITMIIISLTTFVVVGSGFGFMVYKVSEQGERLALQVETLEAERAQENSYNKLQRLFEETRSDRSKLQSYFLESESSSIDFLNLVESLAEKSGMVLVTDSVDGLGESEEQTQWIVATFSFSGSREQIHNFIKVLESLPYVLRLTSADLSLRSSSEWGAKVTMQVQILDYDK